MLMSRLCDNSFTIYCKGISLVTVAHLHVFHAGISGSVLQAHARWLFDQGCDNRGLSGAFIGFRGTSVGAFPVLTHR